MVKLIHTEIQQFNVPTISKKRKFKKTFDQKALLRIFFLNLKFSHLGNFPLRKK